MSIYDLTTKEPAMPSYMRAEVVIVSDNEAEIHYRPMKLLRWLAWLFDQRTTFSPIVRVPGWEVRKQVASEADGRSQPYEGEYRWVHKYTGRQVSDEILNMLERVPVRNDFRQAMLAAAMEVEE